MAHQNATVIAVGASYRWPDGDNVINQIPPAETGTPDSRRRDYLLRMPYEIIQAIGASTARQQHLSRLSSTCRRLYDELISMLYHRASGTPEAAYPWTFAVRKKTPDPIRRALTLGLREGSMKHLWDAARSSDTNLAVIEVMLEQQGIMDRLLLDQGDESSDPVLIAIMRGHKETAIMLVMHVLSSPRTKNLHTALYLHFAIRMGLYEVVVTLLDAGAGVATKDGVGCTPLAAAAETGQLDICQLLLQRGADANERCNNGRTAILAAVHTRNVAVVSLLIEHGAPQVPKHFRLLSETAVKVGYPPMVQRLLAAFGFEHLTSELGAYLIHMATETGQVGSISVLLRYGVAVDARNNLGATPLHTAAVLPRAEVANFLIDNGADMGAVDQTGSTALSLSARSELGLPLCRLLISRGANVHHVDTDRGNTVLHNVTDGHTLRLLLGHGAARELNARNKDGATAFLNICRYADIEMLELMLEHGADINAVDEEGHTANHYGYEGSDRGTDESDQDGKVLEYLLEHGLRVSPAEGGELLHKACKFGENGRAKVLIGAGADVRYCDESGFTVLHQAVQRCSDEVIQLLLQQGADANARSYVDWETPLLTASYLCNMPPCPRVKLLLEYGADPMALQANGNLGVHSLFQCQYKKCQVIKELVRHGVGPNSPNNAGQTLLMLAAATDEMELVAWLLEKGADVTRVDSDGRTALHEALSVETATVLLEFGADVNARDHRGQTPLLNALQHGSNELLKCLLQRGANVTTLYRRDQTILHQAATWQGNAAMIDILIRYGASIEAINRDRETPLYLAVAGGCVKAARALLGHGADMHKLCGENSSPYHVAICRGRFKVVELLLDRGAGVDVAPAGSMKPLFHAAYHGHAQLTKLLLYRGADMHQKDENGARPSDLAAKNGHHVVAKLLGG